MSKQKFVEDLDEDDIERIAAMMRPGMASDGGFLSPEESLREVIEADARTLEKWGVTYDQIADRLDFFICQDRLQSVLEKESLVEGKYKVHSVSWLRLPYCCHFPKEDEPICGQSNTDYTVYNLETGESRKFPGLMPHLVRDHHFFEGRGRSNRFDPEDAIYVLGVEVPPEILSDKAEMAERAVQRFESKWANFGPEIYSAVKFVSKHGTEEGVKCIADKMGVSQKWLQHAFMDYMEQHIQEQIIAKGAKMPRYLWDAKTPRGK